MFITVVRLQLLTS